MWDQYVKIGMRKRGGILAHARRERTKEAAKIVRRGILIGPGLRYTLRAVSAAFDKSYSPVNLSDTGFMNRMAAPPSAPG
jgi:hypothetical protein